MVKGLFSFDFFSKTVEEARIRTSLGGMISILTVFVIVVLTIWEIIDFRRVEFLSEVRVDKARVLYMDILDISGEVQEAITAGVHKTRVDENGREISSHQIKFVTSEDGKTVKQIDESDRGRVIRELYEKKGSDYCGSCWGSVSDGSNGEPGEKAAGKRCCDTCADVRIAYSEVGWAFHDGSGIKQCEEEGYQEWIEQMKNEGCNVAGAVKVNKVAGNFHFAPGASFTFNGRHSHDLSLYGRKDLPYNFAHNVHELSFGAMPGAQEEAEERIVAARLEERYGGKDGAQMVKPLNGQNKGTEDKHFTFQYFLKVVATRYELLDHKALETNQYSVTSHERNIVGGRDADHPHTAHGRGGVPGVYFQYDISPLKVINKEHRPGTLGNLVTSVLSMVGAAITLGSLVDFTTWEISKEAARRKGQ
ncbi:uncharacterized protein SAPINGB_P005940 [Magnusiomyces paraingens]|uniref:Endoplasmic reticulum-Golgi intermediate compartment protein n=1 Tax=Magnusiomyces paraingens TaxID=2606893 RepID=A0A5E8C9D2_9ASCO|nr:uncharacterized protein SAPINGB_P005940 [Saprochaete ingens]VVT57906.1 unnamed protein product [Saprochaete ingens]